MWTDRIVRFGSGCGIEIRGEELFAVAVKSRPAGVSVLGAATIAGFRERAPEEWGAEYRAFLERNGLAHVAATVSLPRAEVIVRQIQLPAMSEKERAAAVRYQLDGLHPFGDDEVRHAYAVVGEAREGAPVNIVVLIAEQEPIDAYARLFEQAGVAVASFTVAAAGLWTAVRMPRSAPPRPFVIADFRGGALEVYGESAQRPAISVEFDLSSIDAERALRLAAAELRTGDAASIALVVSGRVETAPGEESSPPSPAEIGKAFPLFEPRAVSAIVPSPLSAPEGFDPRRDLSALGTALESACPRLGWRANLLPVERRKSDSRLLWAPTAALLALLVLLGLGFALRPAVQDRAYAAALREEIARLEAVVAEVDETRARAETVRARLNHAMTLLGRTSEDLVIIRELSVLIPDTAWLNSLEINDDGVRISGEAESAAPLLGILSEARAVDQAAFGSSLVKVEEGERFQIVAARRTPESGVRPVVKPIEASLETPAAPEPEAAPEAEEVQPAEAPAAEAPVEPAPEAAPEEGADEPQPAPESSAAPADEEPPRAETEGASR